MGFFEMCLLGYKIIAFIALGLIGLASAVAPIVLVSDSESLWPITLYIICVPIICGCIKLMQLL